MDYQPLTPPSGQQSNSAPTLASMPDLAKNLSSLKPQAPSGGSRGPGPIMLVLVIIFGIGTLVFAMLTLAESSKATNATNILDHDISVAATNAAAEQKKTDIKNETAANESPFRAYTAPLADGAFVINFPKDWSGWVDQESSGTKVDLILNPNFVQTDNGTPDLAACTVQLVDQRSTDYMSGYSGNVQSGQLQQKSITVSGISGFDLTGNFGDQRTTRMVIVPVRDQVIVFTNENGSYGQEFSEILAQAKINP
jgi:hypothetical protein